MTNSSLERIDPLRVLAGPTGVGKSELALAMARRHRGAIVTADSMQVYEGLAIGTAQPGAEERAEVPHRLAGHVSPTETYDAARFVEEAEAALGMLVEDGFLPFVVGGTGLYLKALIDGLFEGPSRDPEVRRRLQEEAERQGSETLHAWLREVDPEASERILSGDTVRIVRALEVYETTGNPISWWQAESRKRGPRHTALYVVATRDREDLYARIDKRVRAMLEAGWVEEVRGLLERGIPEDAPGYRALGYGEILAHLRGELSEKDLAGAIAQASRRYSKRQLTWFRAVKGVEWINLSTLSFPDAVAAVEDAWELKSDPSGASGE